MNNDVTFEVSRPDAQRVVATLREGTDEAEITGWNPERSAAALLNAVEVAAGPDAYSECFWPEPTGHYWWMFKRTDQSLETVVLWSRSSAVGWQHVFRACDEVGYVRDLIQTALAESGLRQP
jgi:hypothetical protein